MFETKWLSGMLEMAACRWTCEGSIQSHSVVLCRVRSGARIDIVNFCGACGRHAERI